MILLVTPGQRADLCAAALTEATGEEVILSETLRRAASLVRTESYSAVVLDQYLLETEPDEIDTLFHHLGTAIPVQVNLGISGVERLTREVRAALRRREREVVAAREAAMQALHSELNSTVTALLLCCQLALDTAGLPPAAVDKLHSTLELVEKLRSQLQSETRDEVAYTPR